MYASGRGVREDYREALTWYRSYMLWPLDRVGVGVDAKKGNHWPRRMGYHRSIGNCATPLHEDNANSAIQGISSFRSGRTIANYSV